MLQRIPGGPGNGPEFARVMEAEQRAADENKIDVIVLSRIGHTG